MYFTHIHIDTQSASPWPNCLNVGQNPLPCVKHNRVCVCVCVCVCVYILYMYILVSSKMTKELTFVDILYIMAKHKCYLIQNIEYPAEVNHG